MEQVRDGSPATLEHKVDIDSEWLQTPEPQKQKKGALANDQSPMGILVYY